jgi:hemerythrin-like domain-containing protein
MPPTKRTTKRTARATAPRARKRRPAPPDAIAELKRQHHEVEDLFKRFEKAGDGARKTKRRLVESMIEELARHASIEETVFYPAVRAEVDGADDDVLEALEEHHVVKLVLRELEDMDPADERFDAKVTVMMETVRHHVEEEEQELFPEVRSSVGRTRLRELGEELRRARRDAPTRPHPAAPDEPPGNVLLAHTMARADQARRAGKAAVDRVLA